jgi:short-subunit dehydrogenase
MPHKPEKAVVVITGAASGIGMATALAFARVGARLVLAARREEALSEMAAQCMHLGAPDAIAVRTDISDEASVQSLARAAIERFDRVDVWVNNAAVSLMGRFEDCPPAVFRQVIETNIFGTIYGARAALRQFRAQGSGVLINVASVVGVAGQAYATAYGLTRSAILGLSGSLRMELHLEEGHDIHVCTVLPAAIDTPFFQQSANYTGRRIKAPNPVNPPEEVAEAIVRLARKPQREVIVGDGGRSMIWFARLAPALFERVMTWQVERDYFLDEPAPPTDGNLFVPVPGHASLNGGWRRPGEVHARRAVTAALAILPAVAGWLWLRPRVRE